MKTKLIFFIAIFAIFDLYYAQVERYDNYKLVELNPTTEDHIKIIAGFENDPSFDIWNSIKGVNIAIDVLLSPVAFEKYEPIFKYFQIDFKIMDENIQNKIDEQLTSMRNNQRNGIVGKYARYTEINSFINTMVENNPDIASSYTAGTTYENREIKVMVIKSPTSDRLVWLDCGIHAREWASPSTCIYFIDKLIKEYRMNDTVAVNLLNKYEFHVMPVVNPDGYEYTFKTSRLWRKNRKPNPSSSCAGTDLNRNFAFKWMVSGSSNQPCAETYAGPSGGSELETQAVQNSIIAKNGKWDMFFTLHSFGGYWMPPWGYTSQLPSDYSKLASLSKIGTDAIRGVYGVPYKIGPPHLTVGYSASGGSYDWAKALYNVEYAFALELRPAQGTPDYYYGFTLPEDRAILCGEETYVGLKAVMKAISEL